MHTYKVTFTTSIGGEMAKHVEATSRDIAVAKATVASIQSLEDMTERFGALFNVKFGEATEGFAMGLEDGSVAVTVTELSA